MPEKMKFCPNCNQELSKIHWTYDDKSVDDWDMITEDWVCNCPNCEKIIHIFLTYYLSEEGIEIDIEGD